MKNEQTITPMVCPRSMACFLFLSFSFFSLTLSHDCYKNRTSAFLSSWITRSSSPHKSFRRFHKSKDERNGLKQHGIGCKRYLLNGSRWFEGEPTLFSKDIERKHQIKTHLSKQA
jgi:hypothetical protein